MKQDIDSSVLINNNMVTVGNSSLLGRPMMAMDGNLLSAFWNKGACIPDKLVDKKDILNELIDEILMSMKVKSDMHDPADLMDLIKNHRRGSTATAKLHSVKPKEKQRRSWGPDDTWSSRFVTKQSLKESLSKEPEPTEMTKKRESKKSSSSKRSKHSKKTYQHANTESVLNLRTCQPLGGFQARGNNLRHHSEKEYDSDNDSDSESEIAIRLHNDRKLSQKRRELMKMMSWICDEGFEYIHSEKVKTLSEAEVFIDVMLSSTIPVQMTFKVNTPTDINITYQFLPTFKEEYMVLNISKTHCMVMRAF